MKDAIVTNFLKGGAANAGGNNNGIAAQAPVEPASTVKESVGST